MEILNPQQSGDAKILSPQKCCNGHDMALRAASQSCESESITCRFCGETITGSPAYCCLDCSYFVHKECTESQAKIQHPFHSKHSLVRSETPSSCNLCSLISRIGYTCDECGYSLDPVCALSTLHQEEKEMSRKILHFLHDHHLKYYQVSKKNDHIKCEMCETRMFGPDDNLYACLECNFFLHESCSKFSQEIELRRFHEHRVLYDHAGSKSSPLKRELAYLGECNRCAFRCNLQFCYGCCNEFALSGATPDTLDAIRYYELEFSITCVICKKSIEGASYGCPRTWCRFHIHIGCANFYINECDGEIPQEIEKHPLHQDHSFSVNFRADYHKCSVCQEEFDGLVISCKECEFIMDFHCAFKCQTLKHPRHEHILAYLEKSVSVSRICDVCGGRCEFNFYCCVICKFNMHHSCRSLSQTATTLEHVDELSLLDICHQDGFGECYCYVCAGNIHPQHGSYYCKKCEINCHIDCIIPSKIEDKDLLELDKEIDGLENKISTKEQELEAAKRDLMEVERKIKVLKTQYIACKQMRSTWTRNPGLANA